MSDQPVSIIPKSLLEKSEKILFIGSIAIGDFTYLQACFRSLAQQYPNLKMDLWIDEYRGKSPILRWGHKKHDIVYDWIESTSLFNKVFKNVGAWWNLPNFLKQLRQKNYPIVVCLFGKRSTLDFAKKISPEGFIAQTNESSGTTHVAQVFAEIFSQMFGIEVLNWQKPAAFTIDKQVLDRVQARLKSCQIPAQQVPAKDNKIIFINAFAKNIKRCWSVKNVFELIRMLQMDSSFADTNFIINTLPDKKEMIENFIKKNSLRNVHVFTVEKSFYELPAIISLCDLIISVDAAVVHLAYAQGVPIVALMRQKNLCWVPPTALEFAVFAKRRSHWTRQINVEDVFEKVRAISLKK